MAELAIVDTHAHLDMKEFDSDRDEVIRRARDAGVERIVTIGIDLKSSHAAVRLAEAHEGIYASVGVHPHEAGRMTADQVEELSRLAAHPRVVAIGEIGLDFHRNYSPRDAQFRALGWQLELAARVGMPVIIHCRDAEADMLRVLREWAVRAPLPEGRPRGVIHCFSRDIATAQQYLDMGFFLSLAGYIGYPSSRDLHETIRALPFDRLVVETDCPYFPSQKYRGKRSEPAHTVFTVEALAEIRGITPVEAANETTRNASRLFGLERH